jgi:hypothetical protein
VLSLVMAMTLGVTRCYRLYKMCESLELPGCSELATVELIRCIAGLHLGVATLMTPVIEVVREQQHGRSGTGDRSPRSILAAAT